MIRRGLQQKEILKIEAINDEHAEKQQMAPLAEGEEEGEGVNNIWFIIWYLLSNIHYLLYALYSLLIIIYYLLFII